MFNPWKMWGIIGLEGDICRCVVGVRHVYVGDHKRNNVVVIKLYIEGFFFLVDGNVDDCALLVLIVVFDKYLGVAFVGTWLVDTFFVITTCVENKIAIKGEVELRSGRKEGIKSIDICMDNLFGRGVIEHGTIGFRTQTDAYGSK